MMSINYKPGIQKILSDMPGNVTIARSGNDLLNRLLLNLNSKLINKSLDIASGTSNVLATHAVNAVDALFVGNLKGLAFAEGDKTLNLYSSGRIEYKPEKKTFKRKKKKGKKALIVAAKEFTKGVSDLKSLIFPQASLPSQTTTILCEMLEEMAVNISNFVQAKGKDCIKQDDVKDAVINLLPDLMSKHAIAEGTKMTNSYETKGREKFGRKIKRTSATTSLEFARGVSYLTSLIFPQASIPAQATEMICKMLEEMTVNISEFVQTKAENCIKVEDVRDAIVNLLPEHMSHHAIAEGTRMAFLYEAGSLEEFRRTRRPKDRSARTTQKSTSRTTKKTQKRKRETMESPEIHKSTRTSASTQRPKRRRVTASKQRPKIRKVTASKQRPKIKTRRSPERLKSRRSTKRTKKSKARTRRRTQKPKSRTVERTRKRKITEGPEEAYSTPSGSIQRPKRRRATPRKQSSKIRTRESSVKRKSRRSTERTKKRKARTRRRTQKPKSRIVERTQKRKRKLSEGPEETYSTPSGSKERPKRRRATSRKQSSKIRRESSAKRKSRKSKARARKPKAKTTVGTQRHKERKISAISPLDFAQGVSELTSVIFPKASLQAKTKEIICEMLADMALKISHFVQTKEGKSIKVKNVRSAIVNLLPGPMSGPAIAEGARMTFLYETKSR